jgi:hypothetical protein
VRGRSHPLTPEHIEAKTRLAGAKLCTASMYCAFVGCILLFVPLLGGSPLAAAASVGLGIVGLTKLAKSGMGLRQMIDWLGVDTSGERHTVDEDAVKMQREENARAFLQAEVTNKTRTSAFAPRDALPEAEIAGLLRLFLETFDGTAEAAKVRGGAGEPYATFQRILREHPATDGG